MTGEAFFLLVTILQSTSWSIKTFSIKRFVVSQPNFTTSTGKSNDPRSFTCLEASVIITNLSAAVSTIFS